ncbi:hypothetical protein HK104_002988 [Borealophlyctis nickersoniae]|nr:hypothetical protein HK104_002988 [Borealophlyctis nickersoniae]
MSTAKELCASIASLANDRHRNVRASAMPVLKSYLDTHDPSHLHSVWPEVRNQLLKVLKDEHHSVRLATVVAAVPLCKSSSRLLRTFAATVSMVGILDDHCDVRKAASTLLAYLREGGFDFGSFAAEVGAKLMQLGEQKIEDGDFLTLRGLVASTNLPYNVEWAVLMLMALGKFSTNVRQYEEQIQKAVSAVLDQFRKVYTPEHLHTLALFMLDRKTLPQFDSLMFVELYAGMGATDTVREEQLARFDIAIADLVPTDGKMLLDTLSKRTQIPTLFVNDLKEATDSKVFSEAQSFKMQALAELRLMNLVILRVDVNDRPNLNDDMTYDILLTCASFLGDDEGRWAFPETQAAANALLQTLLTGITTSDPQITSISHLVTRFLPRILEQDIKPYFRHPNVDETGHRASAMRRKVPQKTDFYEDQPWKVEKVDCVEIFQWSVRQVKSPHFGPIQHLLIPPILTLLDDFEERYKHRGVHLLRHVVVENSAPADIRRTGLGDVFFETLCRCLTFHRDPVLIKDTLSCIIDLVPVIEVKESQGYYAKLETILETGVLKGLQMSLGGKVRIVQPTLGSMCELLQEHRGDIPTQLAASEAIIRIVETCWPRVPVYRGLVLKSVAEAWRNFHRDETRDKEQGRYIREQTERTQLTANLRNICRLLRLACGDSIVPGFNLLLHVDEELFEDLVGTKKAHDIL